jgi:hypothetical protein
MSKFSKPKPTTQVEIDRVIQSADAIDNGKPAAEDDVRFTMTLTGEMSERVNRARKASGNMPRVIWIRAAIAEKLAREGM